MNVIGTGITRFFDLLVLPFGQANTISLVALSLVTGVGMAVVFKYTSNPKAIKRTKDKLKGRILEMRIYQDDPLLIFKALGRTLLSNFSYLGSMLKPIAILIIPVMIIFMQMDERFGRSGLDVNDTTRLSVLLKDGKDPFATPVKLSSEQGIVIDTKPVRVARTREIDWRLKVAHWGTHRLILESEGSKYVFPVTARQGTKMIAHERTTGFMEPLIHPAAAPIPSDSPFARVAVEYTGARYPFLVWHVHWIVIFLVYSLLSALMMKYLIKFEF